MAERLRMMAVHAHPDEESSKGAATMARYVAEGHEVMVVTCTGGERGSVLIPLGGEAGEVGRIVGDEPRVVPRLQRLQARRGHALSRGHSDVVVP